MDYLELGFDKFLNRLNQEQQQIGSDEFDLFVDTITGSKINSGLSQSINGRMEIDFDNGSITFKEGTVVRAEIRKFLDNKFGLRVYNSTGDVTIDQTV